jgi:hypothetical protein
MNLTSWCRSLGVRPGGLKTVWRFSLLAPAEWRHHARVRCRDAAAQNDQCATFALASLRAGALAMLLAGRLLRIASRTGCCSGWQ